MFAGYGITAKNLKRGEQTFAYDDYAGIDVEGKVAVIVRKEPQQNDKASPFNGDKTTEYATFAKKLQNAEEHGAVAVILVNDGQELANRSAESAKLLKEALDKLVTIAKNDPSPRLRQSAIRRLSSRGL